MISLDREQALTAVALLLIAGAALGVAFSRSGWSDLALTEPVPGPASSDGLPLAPDALTEGAYAIAVNDQPPAITVRVSFVALAASGWVVVREESDGRPGVILGAKRFDPGTGQTGEVELLRATEEGRVYFAVLHADDGDRQFDHTKDQAITDAQGNAVLVRFVATAAKGE